MFKPFPFALTLLVSGASGCARLSVDHEPVFHTPLADTVYKAEPLSGEPPPQRLGDLRRKAVAFAKSLLQSSRGTGDFGETDVWEMLRRLGIRIAWTKEKGITALARETRRQKAYAADGRPLPGDIVLFHNQRDLNGNGQNDDWLTGCGIVIQSNRTRFLAVIRTGYTPRQVIVTPLTPSTREADGEIINSFVRIPSRFDPDDTEYLAGQLYAGHINIEQLPLR